MTVDSKIRIWVTASDHLTFDYAQARVHYAESGERIKDRQGLVHTIRPTVARYPVGLTISILPEELVRMNSSPGAPRCGLEWLEYHFRAQTEVLVYVFGETIAEGGGIIMRQLAYLSRMAELPEYCFGTLPAIGPTPELLDLQLNVSEDGIFSDFANFSSYSAYSPARPLQ